MTDADLSGLMEPVARLLLGEPNAKLSNKKELRYGSRGSVAVDLAKGTWFDHETQEGGGVFALVAREQKIELRECPAWLDDHGFEVGAKTNGDARSPSNERAKIIATYDYCDEFGEPLFQVVRLDPKDFRQRRKAKPGDDPKNVRDGWVWSVKGMRRVPYRMPEVAELEGGALVFVVEGEKDADKLWSLNIPATTNPGGAGKWHNGLNDALKRFDIVIVPDRDPPKLHPKTKEPMFHRDGRPILPGQDHAQAVAAALDGVAARVRVLELWQFWEDMPLKGDISDWLKAGGTPDTLYALLGYVETWHAPAAATNGATAPASLVLNPVLVLPINEQAIPVRDWIIPGLFLRRHVTVLVAPSGSGKSLLTLQLGLSCAQGRPWAGWLPRKRERVLVSDSA